MQVTIDIPEPLYSEVAAEADATQASVDGVLLRRIREAPSPPPASTEGHRVHLPIFKSTKPGSFDPGEGGIYDYIDFP